MKLSTRIRTRNRDRVSKLLDQVYSGNPRALCKWISKSKCGKRQGKTVDIALAALKQSANGGDVVSMGILGQLYTNGYHVKQDVERAEHWLSRAAIAKDKWGMGRLGILYRSYQSPARFDLARHWLTMAAESGCDESLVELGFMFLNGEGIAVDKKVAFKYFKAASESRHPRGMYMLSFMYQYGHGVEPNYRLAFYWKCASAKAGYILAMYYVGEMFETGLGCTVDKKRALEWYKKAALAGNPSAMFRLGVAYCKGDIAKKNVEKGVNWYKESAALGDRRAMNNLAIHYCREGSDCVYLAIAWAFRAIVALSEKTFHLYSFLTSIPENEIEYAGHIKQIELRAEEGDPAAMFEIGYAFRSGFGINRDDEQAYQWFHQASECGVAGAMYEIGVMYCNGEGVPESEILAFEWMEKAEASGYLLARKWLKSERDMEPR